MQYLPRVLGTISVLALLSSVTGQIVQPADPTVFAAFDTSKGSIQDLSLRSLAEGTYETDVLLEGIVRRLRLWPRDVRSPDFKLLVDDGVQIRQLPTPASVTYRGMVIGLPESLVAASIINGELDAVVRLSKAGSLLAIQPIRRVMPSMPAGRYLVFDGKDSTAQGVCGVKSGPTPGAAIDVAGNLVCEIGCDADYEMYQKNGSNTTNTQNDVTNVMNNVDVIYQRDVQIEYLITAIVVRTARVYTSSDASTLLNQFRSRWNSAHGNIRRDTAHLFTGKSMIGSVIGLAWLRVICNLSQAYGLSESRFTNGMTSRTGLTAHELGHNWGSGHCSGGSCYIMCPGLGGCGRNLTRFGSASIGAILNHKNSRTCLSAASKPVLTSLSPTAVQAFGGQTVTLKGADLLDVSRINIGQRQVIKPALRVVDSRTLTVAMPKATSLGFGVMSASTTQVTSNGLSFVYTSTVPSRLYVSPIGVGGSNLSYQFGGKPAGSWFVMISFQGPATVPLLGFDILANGFVFANGSLDSVGLGQWGIIPPIGNLVGVTIQSQMIELNALNTALVGVTPPAPTLFVF